jgi:hypothetical protein
VLLAIFLLPLGAMVHLKFEPSGHLLLLFVVFGFKAIILAGILHVIDGLPVWIAKLLARPLHVLMMTIPVAACVVVAGWSMGLLLGSGALVVLEFWHQSREARFRRVAASVVPALYLLAALMLIWYYNDIIVSFRFFARYDALFMRLDSWLGVNVPAISKRAVSVSPYLLVVAEQIYFGMFTVLGAGLILIGFEYGLGRAMQFIGAAVLAYYLALACFAMFPSHGPYSFCADHFSSFPEMLASHGIQRSMLSHVNQMWTHTGTIPASGGYFISFPCMHVVKPVLVWWYLRDHRNIAWLVSGYLLLLTIAIVLLEWHYFVDILAGFLVATAVIFITDRPLQLRRREMAFPG